VHAAIQLKRNRGARLSRTLRSCATTIQQQVPPEGAPDPKPPPLADTDSRSGGGVAPSIR
jgi:hypothetical protein